MLKALSIVGIAVSSLLFLVFCLDIAVGIPFKGANFTMSIGFIIFSAILGYLSWTTFREQA
jgi:hypothetical protein